jgi:excisionase family DNA binding protein
MSISFLTNLSEQEFKEFLKQTINEVLREYLGRFPTEVPDDPLDIKQAAGFLKLKITTLYEKTSQRLIPHFKKGNKLYFNRAELEEWVKTGKIKTRQEIESNAATYLLSGKQGAKNKSNV